jgi:plasmid stabilization system protein ParE
MKVVLTFAAEVDLDSIGDAIAKDKPRRAVSFISEIRDSCKGLGEMPEAFPLVPRHEDTGVRRRVHGADLIFYRNAPDAVEVLRVLHGSMNYEEFLFGGPELG